MNDIIFQLHTPEEFRYLSSVGHWIIGYTFLAATIIAFLQTRGLLKNKPYIWPLLVIIAGVILIPYNMLHHGWSELPLVWKVIESDPQQRQHIIMFNLLFVAGVVELLVSLKKVKGNLWQFVWPAVLVVIGYLFLTHPQHGTQEALSYTMPYHTVLGIVLILSGILKTAEVKWSHTYKWTTYGWIIFLFIASIMLITYHEPEGAYQMEKGAMQEHQETMEH